MLTELPYGGLAGHEHLPEMLSPPVPLVGSQRYQEVGNDITPKWAIYKFREFTHLISQLDHACSRLGLCSPDAFGRPLGIRKIVAVGTPMQTRPQTALLIAYKFGQFQPGVLKVSLTTGGYFPSKINRVHDILSGCGRSRAFGKDCLQPIAAVHNGPVYGLDTLITRRVYPAY